MSATRTTPRYTVPRIWRTYGTMLRTTPAPNAAPGQAEHQGPIQRREVPGVRGGPAEDEEGADEVRNQEVPARAAGLERLLVRDHDDEVHHDDAHGEEAHEGGEGEAQRERQGREPEGLVRGHLAPRDRAVRVVDRVRVPVEVVVQGVPARREQGRGARGEEDRPRNRLDARPPDRDDRRDSDADRRHPALQGPRAPEVPRHRGGVSLV